VPATFERPKCRSVQWIAHAECIRSLLNGAPLQSASEKVGASPVMRSGAIVEWDLAFHLASLYIR
jgi:hypothetical protein